MSVKTTPEEFENRVRQVWGNRITLLTPYTKSDEKVLVHYNDCNHEDWKNPHKLLAGQGCSKCKFVKLSITKTKTTEMFLHDLKEKNLNYDLLSEYKGVKEKIKVRNLSCGHVYWACANNILQGSGCPLCHGMKDTELFKSQIEALYPGEYEVLGNYINNRIEIRVRHKCGYEWNVIPKTLLTRLRCPNCLKSYGEYLVANILMSHNIQFEREVGFEGLRDIRPLKFDFICHVDNDLYAIEVDGIQHYQNKRTIYNENYDLIRLHDTLKDKYCNEHSIPLLRIPYTWFKQKNKVETEILSFFNMTT